uniref:Uncharacterized protein n=1 Tax=Parascaris univalens TaxID=6257 RepID=A0A915BUW9_PARUN
MADHPNGGLQVIDRARKASELVENREQMADDVKKLHQAGHRSPTIVFDEVEQILTQLNMMNKDTNYHIIEMMVEEKLAEEDRIRGLWKEE